MSSRPTLSRPCYNPWKLLAVLCLTMLVSNSMQTLGLGKTTACLDSSKYCVMCNSSTACGYCFYQQQKMVDFGSPYGGTYPLCTDKPITISHCMLERKTKEKTVCDLCDNGYYFNKNEQKCVKGNMKNCLIYDSKGNSTNPICGACGNNHYANKTCLPVPQNETIPKCVSHSRKSYTVNGAKVEKYKCDMCEKGLVFDVGKRKCVETCTEGCYQCNEGKCQRCNFHMMYFPTTSGKCKYQEPPQGSYNSFLQKESESDTEKGFLNLGSTIVLLLLGLSLPLF